MSIWDLGKCPLLRYDLDLECPGSNVVMGRGGGGGGGGGGVCSNIIMILFFVYRSGLDVGSVHNNYSTVQWNI